MASAYTFSGEVLPSSLAILWGGKIKKILPWPPVITVELDANDAKKDIVVIRSGDYVVKIMASDVDGGTKAQDVLDLIAAAAPSSGSSSSSYKTYVALISQAGINDPTATVLENSLSGAIVWTRFAEGIYIGTLIGAFPGGKTIFITPKALKSGANDIVFTRSNDDKISITTVADGDLSDVALEVRVYP